jgi:glycosyltransferase involved in cell wall biosynthesis
MNHDPVPTVLLMTPNLEIGGAQENLRTMAKYLPRSGCNVVVCTFDDGPLGAELRQLDVPVEVLGGRRHSVFALPLFGAEMLEKWRELRRVVARHSVTVVQTRGLGTLDFLVVMLRMRVGRPQFGRRRSGPQVWWTIENVRFMVRKEHLGRNTWLLRPKRALHRLCYRVGARIVDGIIVVSDEAARSFFRSVGLRSVGGVASKVHVVANGVDVERFPASTDANETRRRLGLAPGDHLMTMVGTFKRQKGHCYLIDAMAAVADRFPQLHLVLVGDGELRDAVDEQVIAAGLSSRVHLLGSRRDVPELLSASNSFVLPSLWEGLPVALVEAMACGLPVIATAVSGTSQVMVSGATGWLVPPGDTPRLAEAMAELLRDPERAAAMGATARKRVTAWFSARHQAQQLAELFAEDATTWPRFRYPTPPREAVR